MLILIVNNTYVFLLTSSPLFPLSSKSFLNLLLSRPNSESAFYSQNSSRSFSSPQPSTHPSALGSSWPQEPCLGVGLPRLRTSSVAPGSQRTCQVQHGLRPTVLSRDRSSWGWSAEYRCREEERERDKKEKGTWREACGRPFYTTWESNGLHTSKSSKNIGEHMHTHQYHAD